ncbi:MAG: hypothetical protein JWN46_3681 [Acidimicrobiales bacterium]|nr:hypothetical protein [Acidimicrobiales bacterium]
MGDPLHGDRSLRLPPRSQLQLGPSVAQGATGAERQEKQPHPFHDADRTPEVLPPFDGTVHSE